MATQHSTARSDFSFDRSGVPVSGLHDGPDPECLRLAAAELAAAELTQDPWQMSQALTLVARAHLAQQALARAEAALMQALRWARMTNSIDAVVDTVCELADVTERLASQHDAQQRGSGYAARERARDHAYEVAMLAARVADPCWEVKVLLRASDVLDRCGDRDDAVQMQARAMRLLGGTTAADHNPHVMPGLGRLADA